MDFKKNGPYLTKLQPAMQQLTFLTHAVEQRQVAVDPQTKLTDLGCESASRLLSSSPTMANASFYYTFWNKKTVVI